MKGKILIVKKRKLERSNRDKFNRVKQRLKYVGNYTIE